MAGPITTGSYPKALWPGVRKFFGFQYQEHKSVADMLFEQLTSSKSREEDVAAASLGLAQKKPEGTSISYDSMAQEGTATYLHTVWGKGYIITREMLEDNQYEEISRMWAKALARSLRHTREIIHANIFNFASDTTKTGYDGVPLLATDHPTAYGNQSNELATPADLSEASLEALAIQVKNARDSTGLRADLKIKRFIGPNELMFEAQRILKSTNQPATANNDVNAIRSIGIIPEVVIWPFLTDADAYFLQTDAPDGLKTFNRRAIELERDNDTDTQNYKHLATMRFSTGWSQWRAVYGSMGAA